MGAFSLFVVINLLNRKLMSSSSGEKRSSRSKSGAYGAQGTTGGGVVSSERPGLGSAAPSGSIPPPPKEKRRSLKNRQEDVDEIVDVMKVNVDKVLERDQKLGELEERAENLKDGAGQFDNNAKQIKKKFWWENEMEVDNSCSYNSLCSYFGDHPDHKTCIKLF